MWVLCWFIISVEWAVVQSQMQTAMPDYISKQYLRENCTANPLPSVSHSSFAQAAIADVSVCVCVCVCSLLLCVTCTATKNMSQYWPGKSLLRTVNILCNRSLFLQINFGITYSKPIY